MLGNSNAFVNGLVGGWEVAGIYTGRSGPPFTPVLSSDVANNGTSGQWPNRIGKGGTLSNPTPTHWFDFAAFSQPTVAVEKLTFQKSTEIRSRQDALQTICRGRLDIFYPQICDGFLGFRVFQQPRLFSPVEVLHCG
jgi:hypothetical protein